jgi:ABC-type multidrug transport system permease subunit
MSTARLAGTFWQRELIEFAQRRRALLIKLAYPLLLGVPLLVSRAPVFYAATALTLLAGMTSALGASAVFARERHSGLALRYRLLPMRPGALLVERISVHAAIDLLQFSPLLVLVAVRHPEGAPFWPALVVSLIASMLAGNLLGAFASTLSRVPGEVMLYTIIPLLPAFYLAGVFAPLHQPFVLLLSRLLPFTYLHEALLGSLGGSASLAPWEALAGGAGFLIAAVSLTALLGRRIVEAD